MKIKDYEKLRIGDFIEHKHYGLCIISDINCIGLIIRPLSVKGFRLLASRSGCLFNRFLEHSNRLILSKVDNPVIPKLIFQTDDNVFEVHEWTELGEVSSDGKFASRQIKTFSTIEEALKYKS